MYSHLYMYTLNPSFNQVFTYLLTYPKNLVIDLSNGVGVGAGFGIGLGFRNISEGCFKTTNVNKYKIRKVNRTMLGYGI